MVRTTHYLLIALLFFGLFFIATPLYAEDSDRPEPRAGDRLQQVRDEMKDRVQTRQAETQNRLEEARDRVRTTLEERRETLRQKGFETARERIAENMNRFTAAIKRALERMQNIIERIEARMEKLEERGVDTSGATLHLDEAKEFLRQATAALSEVGNVEATDDTTPKSLIEEYREIYREIRDLIKNAHASIREAVSALKDAISNTSSTDSENDGSEASDE